MSQVATESQSSSSQPSNIMSQRVHNNIDSSGIGNAESALPLKSIGLSSSHSDPCPLELCRPQQQQSHDRVRRSRRLVERSAKIKSETADATSQRFAPRPVKQEPPHSSSQLSSQVASTSSAPLPDPSRLPTNELPPPLTTPSTTARNSTIITAPSANGAPESSALTRGNLPGTISSTPTSIQGQHEHSYALTFSSTAEEIPFLSSLETTPTAPPTSRTHNHEASSDAAPIPRSNEATPIALPISSGPATTLNTQMLGSIPTSVIQNSLVRGTARERNSNTHATATSRNGLPSSHMLLPTNFGDTAQMENGANMHTSVAPIIRGMSAPTGHAQNDRSGGVSAPTGHAQIINRTGGIISETISPSSNSASNTNSSSTNPLAALFEVPLTLPMGTDLHIQRTNSVNASLREERQRLEQSTAFIASHAQDRATTSSRRTSSSSSNHNRRRWRRRDNEEMASQSIEIEGEGGVRVRERSSTRRRRQQHVRDRSPVATTSQHGTSSLASPSSLLPRATSTRRRRHQRGGGDSSRSGSGPPPPLDLPGTSESSISAVPPPPLSSLSLPPPPSALLHVPRSSTTSATDTLASRNGTASDYRMQQHTHIGYQVVPQGQTSSIATGSSNSGGLSRPPLPHIHLSQGQGGMPVASNFHNPRHSSSFHNPSSAAGSSSTESVVQVAMPQGAVHVPASVLSLPESHSGTILYPLSTSHSMPSTSHSHIPFHPTSSPHGIGVSVSIAEPVVIVNSSADHEVPRLSRETDMGTSRNSGSGGGADGGGERRESLVEVIVVDSSDSEHEDDDDDVIVSGVSRVPSFPGQLPWTVNRHQISSDEAFARRLQEEFDQEAHDVFAHVSPLISSHPQMVPPPPVPAGPSIPPPRPQPHNHHTHTVDR